MVKTVGELRKLLEGLDDKTPIVTEGSDHDYYRSNAEIVDAFEQNRSKELYEHFGPEYLTPEMKGKIIKVLRVS